MKIYRRIVIAFSIILGIALSTIMYFGSATQMAIHDPVTEEYYHYLKENALKVAKALNRSKVSDETLKADFYFDENELVVTVESIKAAVIAKIPITNQVFNIKDETIKSQGIVEFENVKYETENKLESKWFYILLMIVGFGFTAVMNYFIFYEAWFSPKKRQ